MSYQSELAAISRTPVTLVVMTLDSCGRTFGISPCLAAGEKCYNTFPTCKYRTAYLKQQKDYRFSSADAPLPFGAGERPYLSRIKYLPTEIKENLTVTSRVSIEMLDEPDKDVGIDPYLEDRTSVPNTLFWKKLLTRNKNYKGRMVRIYEGFLGLLESEFQQKFVGTLETIKTGTGKVTMEVEDLLKSTAKIEVPPKLDIKLLNDITETDTEIVLTDVQKLDTPSGYIRVSDEVIAYTGVVSEQNKLTGCTRGAFSTTAAEHKAKDKVQKCRYYAPANPFDILKEMLGTDGGIDPAYIDAAAFDYWKDFPERDIDFSALITEPKKLDKLYFEILDLIDCKSWVAEDLKITIRRNVPNEPGRAYEYLSDDENIIEGSMRTDLNEKSRITRVLCYWDKKAIGKQDDVNSYSRLDIALDADAEGVNEYDDQIEKKVFCQWISPDYIQEELVSNYMRNTISRILFRYRDAMPIVDYKVELKDMDIRTGQYVIISTDEVLDKYGNPVDDVFQIVRRERSTVNTVTYRALKLPWKRFAFIASDTAADYADAGDGEKEFAYVSDDKGFIGEEETSYAVW